MLYLPEVRGYPGLSGMSFPAAAAPRLNARRATRQGRKGASPQGRDRLSNTMFASDLQSRSSGDEAPGRTQADGCTPVAAKMQPRRVDPLVSTSGP